MAFGGDCLVSTFSILMLRFNFSSDAIDAIKKRDAEMQYLMIVCPIANFFLNWNEKSQRERQRCVSVDVSICERNELDFPNAPNAPVKNMP